jgi:cytosine/adenosine deaminase-related metal-dependent hydrolase
MPKPSSKPARAPRAPSRYALEGKIATMDRNDTVIERGVIFIEDQRIKAISDGSGPVPPEFRDIEPIHTGGTIFPGLIELHNHLSYNVLPMWNVPGKYLSSKGWRKSAPPYAYQKAVTKPMEVLASTPGVLPAIVRYVECKCLVAGVTTSQGITLSSDNGIQKHYRGTIRNVESAGDKALPAAHPSIDVITGEDHVKVLGQLEELEKRGGCYLHHLSEGVNETSRKEFLNLQRSDDEWVISRAYAGIHSLALKPEDWKIMARHEGAMIWSPLSNLMLYGETVDIRVPKAAGVRIALGADWSPSGSKNLLGEIKVAHLVSQELGQVFELHEIVAMATRNAAEILGWDAELGSLEPGKRADLMVVNGQQGDPYERLLQAKESSITLVVIDGVRRFGSKRLMEPSMAGKSLEPITIGRAERFLDLEEDDADPMVAGLTLKEARETLQSAMQQLPELAAELEHRPSGFLGGSQDADGTWWTLNLDMNEPADADADSLLAGKQPPLTELIEPQELDALTTIDDPSFFSTLAVQRNLPEYIKDGLPPLYGREPQPAEPVGMVKHFRPKLREQLKNATTLHAFLRTSGRLTSEDLRAIVKTAIVLMEYHYVHLPLKKAMYGINPVQRLKLLEYQLEQLPEDQQPSELEFHKEMLRIFNSTRDLHTRYVLPYPYKDKLACLSYLIEECWEDGAPRYIVSKMLTENPSSRFTVGAEILYWNGVPIASAIERNADRQAGSNRAARHARGLHSMTIRPLAYVLPPEDEWVSVRYRPAGGEEAEEAEITHEWMVIRTAQAKLGFGIDFDVADAETDMLAESMALGLDQQTDAIQHARELFFAPDEPDLEQAASGDAGAVESDGVLQTNLRNILRPKILDTPAGKFGYIRIFHFNVRDADAFVQEFARLLEQMPENGVILDVRGNGGGLIHAAERLLQLFTPRAIEPQRAQFINSPRNLELCVRHASNPKLELKPWEASIRQSVATGATYSGGFFITPQDSCKAIGQRYYGPVVLITDGLCYSATDIFAAGFQDHAIGVILGTGVNTGAGGANIWTYPQLCTLMSDGEASASEHPHEYGPLPHGASMSVAIRRTLRVGQQAGNVLEDLGVEPEKIHHMTRADVLEGNRDLLDHAVQILKDRKAHPLRAQMRRNDREGMYLDIHTANIDRVDVAVADVPLGFVDTRDNRGKFPLDRWKPAANAVLELRGWADQRLVAFRREIIPGDA